MNFPWFITGKQNKELLKDISFESEVHNIYDPKFDSSSEDLQQDSSDEESKIDLFVHSELGSKTNIINNNLSKSTISANINEERLIEKDTPKKIEELNSYREPYKHISLFK